MQTKNADAELAELEEQMAAALALLSDADREEVLAGFARDESRSNETRRQNAIDEFTDFVDRLPRRPVK